MSERYGTSTMKMKPREWARKAEVNILGLRGWREGTPSHFPQSFHRPITKPEFDERLRYCRISKGKFHYLYQPGG